jgi:hypothetical protein
MKRRVFAALGPLTLITAGGALAQSNAVLKADIPFEFHVGAKTLPAGSYDVRPQFQSNVLFIRNIDTKAGAVILTNGVDAKEIPETGKLVFNRYENAYFLSEVFTPGYAQGRETVKTQAEQEFARDSGAAATVAIALGRR